MPIEIKELHIRISVNSTSRQQQAGGAGAVGSRTSGANKDEKDSLVAECVEQVLHILHDKKER